MPLPDARRECGPLRRRLRVALAGLLLALASAPGAIARADAPADTPGGAAAQDSQLQRWVEQSALATWSSTGDAAPGGNAAAGQAAMAGLRVEVSIGRPGAGLRFAPCARIEPFLPPHARLWGRAYIGVRCTEGASWSTMVPVTVSVFGPALVAKLSLPAGAMADADAFRIVEVDWTRGPGLPVTDPAQLANRSLGRPLAAGQVLRAGDLRVPQTISAGDPVKIRLVGQGFTISAAGFALAAAGEGQPLRVRTDSGKLLVGTVRDRSIEVKL